MAAWCYVGLEQLNGNELSDVPRLVDFGRTVTPAGFSQGWWA